MMEKKVHVSWTFQEQNPGKPWKLYQIPGISMEFHVIPWISSLSSMITLDNVHLGHVQLFKIGFFHWDDDDLD